MTATLSGENGDYRRNMRPARRENGPNLGSRLYCYRRNRISASGRIASTFMAKCTRRRTLCGISRSTFVAKQGNATLAWAQPLILLAKSHSTRDHAPHPPIFTRWHDPGNDFATTITSCAIVHPRFNGSCRSRSLSRSLALSEPAAAVRRVRASLVWAVAPSSRWWTPPRIGHGSRRG